MRSRKPPVVASKISTDSVTELSSARKDSNPLAVIIEATSSSCRAHNFWQHNFFDATTFLELQQVYFDLIPNTQSLGVMLHFCTISLGIRVSHHAAGMLLRISKVQWLFPETFDLPLLYLLVSRGAPFLTQH